MSYEIINIKPGDRCLVQRFSERSGPHWVTAEGGYWGSGYWHEAQLLDGGMATVTYEPLTKDAPPFTRQARYLRFLIIATGKIVYSYEYDFREESRMPDGLRANGIDEVS